MLSKAAASKAAPPATEAAAEAPAEGAAAGGTAEGKLAEPVAAAAAVVGGLRIVGHREFLNLTHNWQRVSTPFMGSHERRRSLALCVKTARSADAALSGCSHCSAPGCLHAFLADLPSPVNFVARTPSRHAEADRRGVQQLPEEWRLHAGQECAAGPQPLCAGARLGRWQGSFCKSTRKLQAA